MVSNNRPMHSTPVYKPAAKLKAAANAVLPWLLTIAIAALPFYKGLFNTAIAAYMVCWLLSGNFARKWARVTNSKPIALWGVLTLWVLLGKPTMATHTTTSSQAPASA